MSSDSQKWKCKEEELGSKFEEILRSLYLVIHSTDYAWNYDTFATRVTPDNELGARRRELINAALSAISNDE